MNGRGGEVNALYAMSFTAAVSHLDTSELNATAFWNTVKYKCHVLDPIQNQKKWRRKEQELSGEKTELEEQRSSRLDLLCFMSVTAAVHHLDTSELK